MGKGSPGSSSSSTTVPDEYKPAVRALVGSGLAASRLSAGQSLDPYYLGEGRSPYQPNIGGSYAAFGPYSGGVNYSPTATKQYGPLQFGTDPSTKGLTTGGYGFGGGDRLKAVLPVENLLVKLIQGGKKGGLTTSIIQEGNYGVEVPSSVLKGGKNVSLSSPFAFGDPIITERYLGNFFAPLNEAEAALPGQLQSVASRYAGKDQELLNLAEATARGDFLRAESNPYLQSAIGAAIRPAEDQFTRNFLPAFSSQAINSGAYKGSSARDIPLQNAGNDFIRNILDTSSNMAFQNLARERMLQQGAPDLFRGAQSAANYPIEVLAKAAEAQRANEQLFIDENLAQYQEGIDAPFRAIEKLAPFLNVGQLGQNTTTTQKRSSGQRAGSVVGGAAGGAASGAALGSVVPVVGTGVGAGVGALLGALLGGLS